MDRTDSKIDTPVTRGCSGTVRYVAVSPRGNVSALEFKTAGEAAAYAKECWPDFEQDETRSGKGWDIEVVGAGNAD